MAASFRTLREAFSEHLGSLEAKCNADIAALNAENRRLHKELSALKAQSCLTPREASWELDRSRVESKTKPAQAHMFFDGDLPPCTPKEPVPAEHLQLCVTPRVQLCVTPRKPLPLSPLSPRASQGIDKNCTVLKVPRQPVVHTPLDSFQEDAEQEDGVFEALKHSKSRVSALGKFLMMVDYVGNEHDHEGGIVLERWVLLTAGLFIPEQSVKWLKAKTQLRSLKLHNFWLVGKGKLASNQSSKLLIHPAETIATPHESYCDSIRVGSTVVNGSSWLQPFILHPDRKICTLMSILQGVMILFDIIDFPLQAFRKGHSQFITISTTCSASFWTLECILHFLSGFHTADGVIDMRPERIFFHYVKGWFPFDFLLVVLDAMFLVYLYMDGTQRRESKLGRATKLFRISLMMRGLRFLRLLKTGERFHAVVDATTVANQIAILTRILFLGMMILVTSHYVACAWYFVSASVGADQETWLKVQMIEDLNDSDKYVYSLHWALTQFTPCTNNIAPANSIERMFASFVALFSLLAFSAFLSSLTAAIMEMKKLNYEVRKEEMQIRDFMYERKVPLLLAKQIWQHFHKHYRRQSNRVKESDISFFGAMPKSLHRELLAHLHIPHLSCYAVFREIFTFSSSRAGHTLTEIVSTFTPLQGHDVFLEGEIASFMYFFIQGSATYSYPGTFQSLLAPDYISEAVLWLDGWKHLGRLMVTDKRCELLLLGAGSFENCIAREASEIMRRSLQKYASLFMQHIADATVESAIRKDSNHLAAYIDAAALAEEEASNKFFTCNDMSFDADVSEVMTVMAFTLQRSMPVSNWRASDGSQKSLLSYYGKSSRLASLGWSMPKSSWRASDG